jgi:hypothetical protein
MKQLTQAQRRITAWAGVLAPLIFVLTFTLEGSLRPDYSPMSQYVSALSLGVPGWVQQVNFLVFGALLFVFTRGVADEIRDGKASKGGLVLLTIVAFCYFFSGPFVMDPAGTPLAQTTVHGNIHGILGAIAFMLMPISCFVYLRRFIHDPRWQPLRWWTLGLGSLSAIGVILLTVASKFPQNAAIFAPYLGLIQRILIVPFMAWVFAFALHFLRLSTHQSNI